MKERESFVQRILTRRIRAYCAVVEWMRYENVLQGLDSDQHKGVSVPLVDTYVVTSNELETSPVMLKSVDKVTDEDSEVTPTFASSLIVLNAQINGANDVPSMKEESVVET